MVECGGLENRCPRKRVRGSNPLVSASFFFKTQTSQPERVRCLRKSRKETRTLMRLRPNQSLPSFSGLIIRVWYSNAFESPHTQVKIFILGVGSSKLF